MPSWVIALICFVVIGFILIIILLNMYINKCVINEINNGLRKMGIIDEYIWNNKLEYKSLKKNVKNKIIDHRNGYSFKPRYRRKDADFLDEIYKIVVKHYKKDIK